MIKTWIITGEDFAAELIVQSGEVIEAEHPLHYLVGKSWTVARSECITKGWHGERNPKYVRGKSELKRRGWTDRQIKLYLPEPHDTEPNPHHPGGSLMGLYRIEWVEAAEERHQIGFGKLLQERSA